jgi:tetratricopeptide (TPR) repeat protein
MKSRFSYDHPLIPYEVEFDAVPSPEITEELQDFLNEVHHDVMEGNRRLIKPLKEWIKDYPSVPILKNHLFTVYMLRGKQILARNILKEIRQKHPDYLIGITNEALSNIQSKNKDLDKAQTILGESLLLHHLVPDKDYFHVSEVINYYQAAILLLLEKGEVEEAKKRNNILLEIDADHPAVKGLTQRIALASFQEVSKMMVKDQEESITVEAKSIKYPKTTEKPQFNHIEINAFYTHDYEVLPGNSNTIDAIIGYPKATLAADLESVLNDSFQRYLHFRKKVDKSNVWDANELSFPIHTFNFLSVLHYEECLPAVLELLRRDDEFLDFWFGDYFESTIFPYLFHLAGNHLSLFKEVMMESNIIDRSKSIIGKAVSQLALHHRDRLNEVSQWFEEVLHFFLENAENKNIADSTTISITIAYCCDLKLDHLLPTIKALYNTNLVSELFIGDLDSIKEDIVGQIQVYDIDPVPINIYEAYDGSYWSRKKKKVPTEEDKLLLDQVENDPYDLFSMMSGFSDEKDTDLGDDDQYYKEDYGSWQQNTTPAKSQKVGRNAPCPCGSGKKYKRCCGKK